MILRRSFCTCFKGENAKIALDGPQKNHPRYGFGTHPNSLTQNDVFIRRPSSACQDKSVARAKREERTLWKKPQGMSQNREIRAAMCVSALKKGLKRPPCQSVCECVCVVSHVFLGPKRKMLKSVCECVAGGSPQPFFKG